MAVLFRKDGYQEMSKKEMKSVEFYSGRNDFSFLKGGGCWGCFYNFWKINLRFLGEFNID